MSLHTRLNAEILTLYVSVLPSTWKYTFSRVPL
uniref:Uncharacterized protein n=1 Tax=Podoviridae sp. ctZkC8 TaxID=2825259 RepID=A0A8S5UBK6_9CAUD|nr:MAG TPA: hypothetical protein [Podoviridae sp. ctZkC8]